MPATDHPTRLVINTEIAAARVAFLAADEAEDWQAGDYWFAELKRLSAEAERIPVQR